jgi:hypothetical protein
VLIPAQEATSPHALSTPHSYAVAVVFCLAWAVRSCEQLSSSHSGPKVMGLQSESLFLFGLNVAWP